MKGDQATRPHQMLVIVIILLNAFFGMLTINKKEINLLARKLRLNLFPAHRIVRITGEMGCLAA